MAIDPRTRPMIANQKPHISHTRFDEQQPQGYQGLNLSGIQRVLDNLS